jgi:hypothetical protein
LNQPVPGVSTIIGLFVDIARLRRGPEDLPVSRALLVATLVAYVAIKALLLAIEPNMPGNPAVLIGIDLGVTLLWCAALLRMAHKPERFLQTMTAILGFQLVLSPLQFASGWLFLKYGTDQAWQLPVQLLALAIGVWALVVLARILRSATGWPMFSCVALSIGQGLVTLLLVLAFVPGAITTAT